MVAGQTAADIDRVEEIKKKLEVVYVELEPGTAIFSYNKPKVASIVLFKIQFYSISDDPLKILVRIGPFACRKRQPSETVHLVVPFPSRSLLKCLERRSNS